MSATVPAPVGIDFGTSNSAIATVGADGEVRFLSFDLLGNTTHSYRSLLFFDPDEQEVGDPIAFHAGVEAIEAYLEAMGEGRLIQSFKTHLTTGSIGRTQIGHHAVRLDDMLRLFFERIREHLRRQTGTAPPRVVLGRPVRFAGAADDEANEAAAARLRNIALASGFEDVRFVLEPIAAAYHYERALTKPEVALVADFGGGTTDFCLMRLRPGATDRDRSDDIIGVGGVGIAGDNLDARIIEHVVCPRLGMGTTYVEMGREKPVPPSYYFKLSRWHQLSFLRGKRTRAELERLHRGATDPQAIEGFIHVVENNQGFHLHKAVEQLKVELSQKTAATFVYEDDPVEIRTEVRRTDFERWIAPEIAEIAAALDATLDAAQRGPHDIDRVFMTGGTAFVPAVRAEFEARFGAEKLAGGDELLSIASGLALGGAGRAVA